MSKILSLLLIFCLGIGAVWVYKNHVEQHKVVKKYTPENDLLAANNALATSDVVALASYDAGVTNKLSLGIGLDDFINLAFVRKTSWGLALKQASINGNVIHSLSAGLYPDQDKQLRSVYILNGKFNSTALLDWLKIQNKGTERTVDGISVIDYSPINEDSCDVYPTWSASISAKRIVLAPTDLIIKFIKRLTDQGVTGKDLVDVDYWQRFQQHKLLSLWLRKEGVGLTDVIQAPIWEGLLGKVDNLSRDLKEAFIGVSANEHRLRAGFTLDVRGNTSTIAANLYDNWVKVLQEQRKKLRTILPTIAEVINWVDIENQHDRVRLMAHVDRGMVARLKNLPDDIERILVSQQNQGNGGEVKTVAAIGSDGEKIDEKPNLYTGTASVDDLTYQPDEKLKTAANQDIVGPFSVFINDARYDRKSDKVLIHIKSVATNIPNIGNNSARLQLLVDKAIRKSGQSAVVNVTCGPKRINKPARFIKTSDDNYVAEKTLELSPGINTTDMGAVSGKVVLKLPTSTSINTIPARGEVPRKETFGDVTLTLNSVGTSGFSYEVKGNVDKLIEIRALNKDGKYLKVQNKAVYEKGSSLAGGTLAGNLDFYGVVDTIEIVTAQTIVKKEYPFHLNEFSNYYSDHYGKIRAPTKKLLSQKEFERKAGVICPAPDKGKSNSQSGPFCVQLTDIVQQNGLWMNFVVGSARVAELEDNRSLMTLHMDRAVLRDDRAVDLDKLPATITAGSLAKMKLSSNINFTVPWDVNDQLVGQTVLMAPLPVQLGLLKAMYGKLTVKLPKKLEVRKIKHLRLGETLTTRQLSLTLVSQGVDGYEFLVTKGSDRLLQMVPRDSLGRAIDYEITKDKVTPDGLDIAFKTGEVSSVDVHIAKKVKTITYPVQLL